MELKSQAFDWFRRETKDGTQPVVHYMIESYAADIPEAEDILRIERENKTALPRHLCRIQKKPP